MGGRETTQATRHSVLIAGIVSRACKCVHTDTKFALIGPDSLRGVRAACFHPLSDLWEPFPHQEADRTNACQRPVAQARSRAPTANEKNMSTGNVMGESNREGTDPPPGDEADGDADGEEPGEGETGGNGEPAAEQEPRPGRQIGIASRFDISDGSRLAEAC